MNIHISDERDELLDTGGGIRKARPFLEGGEPFLVHNADILSDIDLAGFYRAHCSSGADATLLVSQRQTSRYLLFDAGNRLHGWINKATGEVKPQGFVPDPDRFLEYAFGGIHVISPTLSDIWKDLNGAVSFPLFLSICLFAIRSGYKAVRFRVSTGST